MCCLTPEPLQLEALEYLHENEYVHADIKAANILVGHEAKQEVWFVPLFAFPGTCMVT